MRRVLLLTGFMLVSITSGCVSEILDAPFMLVGGMGPIHDVALSPASKLLLAVEDGVVEVDADGSRTTLLQSTGVGRVASHRRLLYTLGSAGLDVAHWSEKLPLRPLASSITVRPRDLQPACDGGVVLAVETGVVEWSPVTNEVASWKGAPTDVEHLALHPAQPCAGVLALTRTAVHWITRDSSRALVEGLEKPRAIAADRWGGVWVVHDTPPVLARLSGSGLETRARHVGEVSGLVFGPGNLFHPANAYLVGRDGRIDYARVVMDVDQVTSEEGFRRLMSLSDAPAPP